MKTSKEAIVQAIATEVHEATGGPSSAFDQTYALVGGAFDAGRWAGARAERDACIANVLDLLDSPDSVGAVAVLRALYARDGVS